MNHRVHSQYSQLFPTHWFGLGRVRAWRAPNHLLLVETRWFHEYYTRLGWPDIQILALYELHRHVRAFAILEAACFLAAMVPLTLWNVPWAFVPAALFALFYIVWRFALPHWACQISTRTSTKRFAIPGTLVACRRIVNELKNSAAAAQNVPEKTMPAGEVVTPTPVVAGPLRSKEPIVAVHVIAFVLGVVSPFHPALFVFFCIALAAAYFFERDFDFPLVVRSAAVMSRIFAVLQIAFWVFVIARLSFGMRFSFEHWQFGMPRVLMCLYGIAAVCWPLIEKTRPQRKASTVLGLS